MKRYQSWMLRRLRGIVRFDPKKIELQVLLDGVVPQICITVGDSITRSELLRIGELFPGKMRVQSNDGGRLSVIIENVSLPPAARS
jgi:hypothetical protein